MEAGACSRAAGRDDRGRSVIGGRNANRENAMAAVALIEDLEMRYMRYESHTESRRTGVIEITDRDGVVRADVAVELCPKSGARVIVTPRIVERDSDEPLHTIVLVGEDKRQ